MKLKRLEEKKQENSSDRIQGGNDDESMNKEKQKAGMRIRESKDLADNNE